MEQIIYPLIVWAVCGIAGFVIGLARGRLKKHTDREDADRKMMEALCDGMRSLLRNKLVEDHHDMLKNGGCTLLEKEVADRNYKPYHALGGNGLGTQMYEEIMDAPTINE